jgi:hypothetical protein
MQPSPSYDFVSVNFIHVRVRLQSTFVDQQFLSAQIQTMKPTRTYPRKNFRPVSQKATFDGIDYLYLLLGTK